jgi:hypothetical protein
LRARILIGLLLVLLIIEGNQFILLHSGSEDELKPLEINGPTLAEVNETISFIVTSEGQPVKGAAVYFAGYEKETNESGVSAFRIDFVGCFKVTARKDGYKTTSSLLWVFPKGSDKFRIRAIRHHTEQAGSSINVYKMIGANYASIKVYYLYDENGNIYPASPFPPPWRRLTREEHEKLLEWQILLARSWGFKIYLMAQPLPEALYVEGKERRASLPPLDGEAKRNFLEQMKGEALWLATLAQKYKVDILDAFGLESTDIGTSDISKVVSDDFLAYKEILPEIRKRFSGKLAVMLVGGIQHFLSNERLPEYDYGGFDYLELVFSCRHAELYTDDPYKWEEALERYLRYANYIKEKYGVKILLIWIAGIETHDEMLLKRFLSNGNFKNYEEAKIWLLNSILRKALEKDVEGVELCTLWFFSRLAEPHGPHASKFSVWQSKKPLSTASKYLYNPWNHKKAEILKKMQYVASISGSISSSSSPALQNWIYGKMKEAYEEFIEENCSYADHILTEVLGYFQHVVNPLSITIDGYGNEWKNIDPVYFNPSRFPQWGPEELWLDNLHNVKRMGNLKAAYALNDRENLYFILEFYGAPPSWLPNVAVDTSGNWTHEFGEEFHIPLRDGLVEIWKVAYVGSDFDPQGPGSEKAGVCEVRIGDVVEVKIPLKILRNPRKVNLMVWYPWIAPWGDMEVDLVNWSAPCRTSSIYISTSSSNLLSGGDVVVSGFIYPAHPNSKVALTYTMPNGAILTREVITKALGEFEDVITPSMAGNWSVKASWSGDHDHEGASSPPLSFTVFAIEKAPPHWWQEYWYLIASTIIICITSALFIKVRARKKH